MACDRSWDKVVEVARERRRRLWGSVVDMMMLTAGVKGLLRDKRIEYGASFGSMEELASSQEL